MVSFFLAMYDVVYAGLGRRVQHEAKHRGYNQLGYAGAAGATKTDT